jgi:uncharacterized membrane protein
VSLPPSSAGDPRLASYDEDPDDPDLDELAAGEEPVITRSFGLGLVVLAAIGLYAAFSLSWDKVKLLEDPTFVPGCDLNPVLSCGSVMATDQAEAFGFPNPFLGLIGFSVVATVGVLMASGTRPRRGVVVGLAVGALGGLVLIHWLAFQSLYRIGALCPWCMVVWSVTIPTAVWSTLVAARLFTDNVVVHGLWAVRYLVVVLWYLTFAVLILVRFWDYWRTVL